MVNLNYSNLMLNAKHCKLAKYDHCLLYFGCPRRRLGEDCEKGSMGECLNARYFPIEWCFCAAGPTFGGSWQAGARAIRVQYAMALVR